MSQRTSPLPAKQAFAKAFNAFNLATFTIGTKSVNTINVAVQLLDARGQALQSIVNVQVYLSDLATGGEITPTVPTSTLAIGTNGKILAVMATDKMVSIAAKNDGTFDLNITQTAGGTNYYLVVVMPDGSLVISAVIAF